MITGPIAALLSPDPWFAFSSAAHFTSARTIALEHAEHFCPWNVNAELATPFAAFLMSAVESTIIAFFPPISATTRLIHLCPSAILAACSLILHPTAFDTVKFTNLVSGCSTMKSPISDPDPGM